MQVGETEVSDAGGGLTITPKTRQKGNARDHAGNADDAAGGNRARQAKALRHESRSSVAQQGAAHVRKLLDRRHASAQFSGYGLIPDRHTKKTTHHVGSARENETGNASRQRGGIPQRGDRINTRRKSRCRRSGERSISTPTAQAAGCSAAALPGTGTALPSRHRAHAGYRPPFRQAPS